MKQKGIHWFPGHMQKALRQIEERLKWIDVVVEIVDSRCPFSSKNSYLYNLIEHKKKVLVMSKKDLSDAKEIEPYVEFYRALNYAPVVADLNRRTDIFSIRKAIENQGSERARKYVEKGMKPQPIRAMIVGIPNVGKSTLINRLAGRNSMSVADTPGHTRAQQWLKADGTLELLDTPGILPPNYENREVAIRLALIGAMKVENTPIGELCEYLLSMLKSRFPEALLQRYALQKEELLSDADILKGIARRRGFLANQGEYDIEKAELLLLREFKEGLIVKSVFDEKC